MLQPYQKGTTGQTFLSFNFILYIIQYTKTKKKLEEKSFTSQAGMPVKIIFQIFQQPRFTCKLPIHAHRL